MVVFIEEDLILESLKSCIDILDKLIIVTDKNLEFFDLIKDINNEKVKIIKIKNKKAIFKIFLKWIWKM